MEQNHVVNPFTGRYLTQLDGANVRTVATEGRVSDEVRRRDGYRR
jgi:hypothetical protein